MKRINCLIAAMLVIANIGFAQSHVEALKANGFQVKSVKEMEELARRSDSTTLVIMTPEWCSPGLIAIRHAETLKKRIRVFYFIPYVSSVRTIGTVNSLIRKLNLDKESIIFSSATDSKEHSFEDIKSTMESPYSFIYKNGKYIGNFLGTGERGIKDYEQRLNSFL